MICVKLLLWISGHVRGGTFGLASGLAARVRRSAFVQYAKGDGIVAYRQGRNYENLNKAMFDGSGAYGIPSLEPTDCVLNSFIGFNYAKTCKDPASYGVHFFIDDYQFTRLWSNPDAYMDLLRSFRCVLTPDFSTYTDFPKAIQIYNHYRKHWLGAYWQANGFTVIPTISWSDESSFDWCFDGEPVGGTVAVSSIGTQVNRNSRVLFLAGYREMIARLKPSAVLFYGTVPDECAGNIIQLTSFQERLRQRVSVGNN